MSLQNQRNEVLAVIPARGGSKGVPGKNVKVVGGSSLIERTVVAAKSAKYVSRIVVSTDSSEIAGIAEGSGVEVVWRPSEISGDSARSEEALLNVLEYLESSENYMPDLLVFLQCTSPFTVPEDIDGVIDRLLTENADTAFSAYKSHVFLWKYDDEGNAEGINHTKSKRSMRQELAPEYAENGAVYVMKTIGFLEHKHRFFGKTVIHEMPQKRSIEIDEPIDFIIAEAISSELSTEDRLSLLPNKIEAIIFDFDGVFTDNRVIVHENGYESVIFSRSDGMGFERIRGLGIKVLVLSKEKNPVVKARCDKLDLQCLSGIDDKLRYLKKWMQEHGVNASNAVYVGNDINDLECLKAVGCPVVVADAHADVIPAAKIRLCLNGGSGAVRELLDMVLKKCNDGRALIIDNNE